MEEEACKHVWKPLGLWKQADKDGVDVVKATIYCENCGEIKSREV